MDIINIPQGMIALTTEEIDNGDAPWSNCIDDCINEMDNISDFGPSCIVKCTLKDLHTAQYRTFCGSSDANETCFKFASKKYPETPVITCIHTDDKTTSSCAIFITSIKQGKEIAKLVEKGGGSLRFDDADQTDVESDGAWFYFENE